jgi:hypothetical protein
MNPGSVPPYSQEPATCPSPEPDQSSPCPTSYFLKNHINIILYLRLGLQNGLFASVFPFKSLHELILSLRRATCPVHCIVLGTCLLRFGSGECAARTYWQDPQPVWTVHMRETFQA